MHEFLGNERYIGMRSSVKRLNMVIGKVRQRLENTIGLKIFCAVGAYEKKDFFCRAFKMF